MKKIRIKFDYVVALLAAVSFSTSTLASLKKKSIALNEGSQVIEEPVVNVAVGADEDLFKELRSALILSGLYDSDNAASFIQTLTIEDAAKLNNLLKNNQVARKDSVMSLIF